MSQPRGGRPRDEQLHLAILAATRDLLRSTSYADLSMDAIAVHAKVGKKTLYRRWPSKAPLVAEAVLDAYGRSGSFAVPDTGNLAADLRSWLVEHLEFIAEPASAGLIRALIAAGAANSTDNKALREQLTLPQREGLTSRLERARARGDIEAGTDVVSVADALIGVLLLQLLTGSGVGDHPRTNIDGLLRALLNGIATTSGSIGVR